MLTKEQIDTLKEIFNAGIDKAGHVLSELVGLRVRMHIPLVGVADFTDLHNCIEIANHIQLVSVCQRFHGTINGYALLLLSSDNGRALTGRLMGAEADATTSNTDRSDALIEVGNILTNSVLGTISNALGHKFEYQVPVYHEGTLPEIIALSSCAAGCVVGNSHTLYARAQFDFDDERVVGSILILLTAGAFDRLIKLVDDLKTKVK